MRKRLRKVRDRWVVRAGPREGQSRVKPGQGGWEEALCTWRRVMWVTRKPCRVLRWKHAWRVQRRQGGQCGWDRVRGGTESRGEEEAPAPGGCV